jgi:hypothetical protein
VNDAAFARIVLVLLLLAVGGLMLLDAQRQRQLYDVRREVDNLHARMNGAGLIDTVGAAATRYNVESALRAHSNDDLNRLAKEHV